MNPRVREILAAIIGNALAIILGAQVASGSAFSFDAFGAVAGAAVVVGICASLMGLFRLRVDVLVLGFVLFGYIVGNRGFAQLMPAPRLPLLPAEIALLLAGSWWLISSAYARRLPWQPDALNMLVLLWIAVGSARLLLDLRPYGIMAVRDYATVYYALFFFIAQSMARTKGARRLLINVTLMATVLVLPGIILTEAFPAFFFGQLTVRGAPLIYYKGDLGHLFLGVGALLVFFRATGPARYWAAALSAAMFLYILLGNSRAALVGLLTAMTLLLLARRWRFPALQATTIAVGLLSTALLASVFDHPWAERKITGVTDRVQSLVDIHGTGTYRSQESFNKGDNNLFRLVWWRNVWRDTWQGNPVLGLGFGYDLAHTFLQEYYPEAGEEFSTRSPHNIFLTVFGRLGLVGLLIFGGICAAILRETWRSLRHEDDQVSWALWCSLWVVLVGATLGVVLEGPMGAVPFWTLLGIANAGRLRAQSSQLDEAGDAISSEASATRAPLDPRPAGVPLLPTHAPASPLAPRPSREPPRAH